MQTNRPGDMKSALFALTLGGKLNFMHSIYTLSSMCGYESLAGDDSVKWCVRKINELIVSDRFFHYMSVVVSVDK